MAQTLIYESDCMDGFESEDDVDSVLIGFTNEFPFGGAYFPSSIIFYIRVEGRFFRERMQQESESESMTDNTVVLLSGSVKQQRLLEVDALPYHAHLALSLALTCQYVVIDGETWVREESYTQSEINPRHPMEKASVWLTAKENNNYTNVFGEP